MAMALRVVVPPHPLLSHWLCVLRDAQTPQPLFATAMAELGRWLTYEALRDWLPRHRVTIETPLATCDGELVDAAIPLLAVAALRAGLGLWQGAQAVLPAAQLAHLTMKGATVTMAALPEPIPANAGVLVFWPELAEPEPLLAVLDLLAERGVSGPRLRLITSVASGPALKAVGERYGDLTLYAAAIDADLDEEGRVLPGLGVLEERLFGFRASH